MDRLWLRLLLLLVILMPSVAEAFAWTPSDEAIQKYRQSWNPFSHGPILLQAVDIQPKGQLSVRPFVFTQIGEHSYGNRFGWFTERRSGPVDLYSVAPSLNAAYGLTNHVELGLATGMSAFWSQDSLGRFSSDTGLGDTSVIVKYRPVVQDPDTWRPSITLFSQLVLPTSRWVTDTHRPPGGFAPLGRLPNTRFGELAVTEGVMYRKNFRPFRVSAAAFYTVSAPGRQAAMTTYAGDVINTRLIFEHIVNERKGLAYNLEFIGLHGVPWRLDGQAVNIGQRSGFTVLGVEPVIQYKFTPSIVAAAGILFTVAGQNAIDAIYPNFSIFWYWSKTGKVIMR